LVEARPQTKTQILLAVGQSEPDEFHHQARSLAAAWSRLTLKYESITETNHFTIVDAFANPATQLHRHILGLISA
jgi:arylformamidase